MDFSFTPEQELLRKTAREFAEKEIASKVDEMEETGKLPMDLLKKIAELGFMGVLIPPEYGGTNAGHIARIIILEEIGRINAAIASTLLICHLGQTPIIYYGSKEQKKKWLPSLVSGEKLATLAVTEPVGGSDVLGIQTTAKKDGDNYILNGKKYFITNAHIADLCGILAKTGEKKLSYFIVEKDTLGYRLGKEEKFVGLKGCTVGEIFLENCKVPKENLIGKEGDGLRIALSAISNVGRPGVAAVGLGITRRCLEEGSKYANERTAYGKPIGKIQAVQWLLTDMYVDYQISRLSSYYAAWLRDQGVRCDAENSLAKFWGAGGAARCAHKLVQIFGGYGVMNEFVSQRLLRDAETLIPMGGTLQIMRLIMARAALKFK
jgi:alkylation response protein AidB-like acyl-CoA dehydrogenase